MKHFSLLPVYLLVSLLLVGACKEKEDPEKEYKLSLSPTSLVFPDTGGSQDFVINTDAPTCQISLSDNSWMGVSAKDKVITVTVQPNSSKEGRTGTVTVDIGTKKAEVSIMQGGKSIPPAEDPYPTCQYGLADESIFVKSDYIKAISGADPSANTFTVPVSSVGEQKPEVGQKLIMNTPTDLFPDGLLAKVVSVSESGGNYQVKYEHIKLEEAFENLQIDETPVELNVLEVRDAKGNKVPFAQTKAPTKETYHLEIPAASWPLDFAGLEVAPILEMDLTLYFQALVENLTLYYLNFDAKVDLTVGATVACGFEGKAIDERFPLYFVVCGAVPVGPILITPTISIDALLEASGKISVEATTKFKASRRYGVHYDINTGWGVNDYPNINNSGSLTVENVSPKAEGTIAYGYSIGPTIAIYAKAVTAGIGYDSKTKNTLSGSYDVLHGNAADYMNWNLVQHLQNAEVAVTDVEAFSVYGSVLTREVFSKSTPDITADEEKWKVLPKLGTFPEFERVEDGLELTVWVKNRHVLGGQLSARVAENPKDVEHIQKMVFPDSRATIESLNSEEAPDSVALKGFVHLDEEDPDLNYAEFLLDVPDFGIFNLGSFLQDFKDEEVRAALMDILRDLYSSRAPGAAWEGCNWFEKDIPVYSLKGVRVSRRGDQFFFKINLNADWKMGPTVTVNDHSKGIAKFGGWELIIEDGAGEGIENLLFYDSHFTGYWLRSADNNLSQLTINSPLWNRMEDLGSGMRSFNVLDLSQTAIEGLEIRTGGITVKEDLVLKNCKGLKNLKFTGLIIPKKYDVTGCDALEEIDFESVLFPEHYFISKESGTPEADLVIEDCTLDSQDFPQNFREVFIKRSSFNHIDVTGNKSMKYLDVKTSKGNSLTVNDSPEMGGIIASDTDIAIFEVNNLPGMNHIEVENNKNLLRLVPEVFDQIQDGGGSVSYDIRYEYSDDGAGNIEYTDNGYGFWYETEPACGYHGRVEPGEDEEGYVTHPGESAARAAFRKVLQDLYRCRKGEWEGCDWLDGSKTLGSLKNVFAPEQPSYNETYSVTIPEEWQFGPDVLVKKHNKLATEQYGGEAGHYEDWRLIINGERYYNSFTINDLRCNLIVAPGEAKTFAVHSPSFFFQARGDEPNKYRSHVIPSKIHTLDLRGCGTYDLDYHVAYENVPKVIKLRRYDGKDDMAGLRVSIRFIESAPQEMPTIQFEGTDGYNITIINAKLPYGALPITVETLRGLALYNCTGDMVYAPENVEEMTVGLESGSSTGRSNIKEVKIQDHKTISKVNLHVQENVTISSCPFLENISGEAEYTYTVTSCPAATWINVSARDVKIKDCKALDRLDYSDYYQQRNGPQYMDVDDCPALTEVDFHYNTAIQGIQMTNVPALVDVDLRYCTSLTMVVPSFFEEVWSRSGSLQYEQRYDYRYHSGGAYTNAEGKKFDYTDKGYGFYFSREPNCGYHRK
jgi:hypothetical protein